MLASFLLTNSDLGASTKMAKEVIEREYGFLKIGNKYYEQKEEQQRVFFVEVKKHKVDAKVKMMKEMAEQLEKSLDRTSVLMEALSKLDSTQLELMHNIIFNAKKKVKPVTRRHYCVDMKIGKMILPIVD